METIAKRIRAARLRANLRTLARLSEEVRRTARREVTVEHLTALEAGEVRSSIYLVPIAIACQVRPDWLLFGDGPMVEGEPESELERAVTEDELSDDERALVRHYRLLPIDARPYLLGLLAQATKPFEPAYVAYEQARNRENSERKS